MNEENLNLEIRKFLKKVGITSQKVIENYIIKSLGEGNLNDGWVVKIYHNPLVIWIWIGALVIFSGGIIYKATSRDGKLMDMEVILPKLVTETKEDIKALMLQDALDFPEDIITLISVFVGECSFFFFIFVFSYTKKIDFFVDSCWKPNTC